MALTETKIRAMRSEAGAAHDYLLVETCTRALEGDDSSRRACARILDERATKARRRAMHVARASTEIDALLLAETDHAAPDARRELSAARCTLMACLDLYQRGQRTDDEMASRTNECRYVREQWTQVG